MENEIKEVLAFFKREKWELAEKTINTHTLNEYCTYRAEDGLEVLLHRSMPGTAARQDWTVSKLSFSKHLNKGNQEQFIEEICARTKDTIYLYETLQKEYAKNPREWMENSVILRASGANVCISFYGKDAARMYTDADKAQFAGQVKTLLAKDSIKITNGHLQPRNDNTSSIFPLVGFAYVGQTEYTKAAQKAPGKLKNMAGTFYTVPGTDIWNAKE